MTNDPKPQLTPKQLSALFSAALEHAHSGPDPDSRDELFANELENDKRRAEISQLEQFNKDSEENRNLRGAYATKVYRYLIAFSVASLTVLIFEGWHLWRFDLPDPVIVTLVGSTAVAAIGLVGFVVQGLFRSL